MADKKKFKYVPFMTQRLIARFPKLSQPDTKGEYADGKYKTDAMPEDVSYGDTFKTEIEAAAKQSFPELNEKQWKTFNWPWATKENKDGEEEFFFKFKSPKKKPMLQDAKNKALKEGTNIRGGSVIRIAGVIAAWEKGAKRGVSLWPDAVRIIKLVDGGFVGFGDEEDGFDADDHEPQTFGEDADGSGADSTGDNSDDTKL